MSERLGGFSHPCHGRHPLREPGGHIKINLQVFKDEDTKYAITYQSWHWDLTVYHCAGHWDCTLVPYAICSLQGYPGELVRSSGMDITLDDILTILAEHYNNVKALDALNQELFQLCMGEKETVSDWGVCLSRHLQIPTASFPECFPADCIAELKCNHFYGRLPKWLKAMVAYLKASVIEKMYSSYLWVAREAEKEEVMEPSCSQTTDKESKPNAKSFFPLWKLKGTQPIHLEEEGSDEEVGDKSEDPDGIKGVMEEFFVHLVRVVKEAQKDEKHCYHCSSMDHFICECLLVNASRSATHFNQKEGTALEKGAHTPRVKVTKPKAPQEGTSKV